SSFVYWRTFSGLFAISIPRIGVGRYRKLAAGESAIQGSVPDVVWVARVRFLFVSFLKQGCGAKLGWARLARLWTSGNLLLVGTSRGECPLTPRRDDRDTGWIDHERGGPQYRPAARGWIQIAAKRPKRPDARLEKRHAWAGNNAQQS